MNAQELTAALVAIDSVNPDLVPGGAGEGEIARFVAGWLEERGLEVQVVESVPGRPSVVGIARGKGGGRSLMLNAHMTRSARRGWGDRSIRRCATAACTAAAPTT